MSKFGWIQLVKTGSERTTRIRQRQSDRLPTHNPPQTQPENGSEGNDKLLCQLSTLRGQLSVSGRTGRSNRRKEQTGGAKPPFPNMVHSCRGPRTLPLPSPSLPASRLSACPPCPSRPSRFGHAHRLVRARQCRRFFFHL